MTRLLVGPFNRVEGDLEVQLDIEGGRVAQAHVNATMYRGFEQMLRGKDPRDALVYVPRICGICSVSQSVAAAHALADACGVTMPANARHALNLMLATENLADHLSHFYLFFMPDFTREVYADRVWHGEVCRRFVALEGAHARAATSARQRWFTILGTLGGHWPHTLSVQAGGSARAIDLAERIRLGAKVREMQLFLEQTLFGVPLQEVLSWRSEDDLRQWHRQAMAVAQPSDLAVFLTLCDELGLDHLGPGPGTYLSYGAYPQPVGGHGFAAGVWRHGEPSAAPVDLSDITEDISHAWFDDARVARHPREGQTLPDADKPGAYTWNKAPRLAGEVLETGAIARQLASGQPLIRSAVARCGGTVYTRVLARLIELASVPLMMSAWLQALRPGLPWHEAVALPAAAEAVGLTEAARGALGHWLRIEQGRIANYQIVAPTSWNFSPRDARGRPGALEQALVGAPVLPGETTPVAVQHIVRSFDPCMVCTVH